MHTNLFQMTSLVILDLSSYSVPKVCPPLFLRESVPQLWSRLRSGDSGGGQNGRLRKHKPSATDKVTVLSTDP
jgi:hypothetical protein